MSEPSKKADIARGQRGGERRRYAPRIDEQGENIAHKAAMSWPSTSRTRSAETRHAEAGREDAELAGA